MDIENIIENLTFLKQLESKSGLKVEKTPLGKPESFDEYETDRIIQMAWEDRTPFEAIEFQFGLLEKETIEFMRKNSLPSSFKMWRKRMANRKTKHQNLRETEIDRFKCTMQRSTGNKISKR